MQRKVKERKVEKMSVERSERLEKRGRAEEFRNEKTE